MKTIDYDEQDKNTGNTETHIATDEKMREGYSKSGNALEEGFAASSGVRPETAASGGRIKHPEMLDEVLPDRVLDGIEDEPLEEIPLEDEDSIEEENAGLADA